MTPPVIWTLLILIPSTWWDANPTKVAAVNAIVWESAPTADPSVGWNIAEMKTNAAATARYVIVTELQTRKTWTAAELDRIAKKATATGAIVVRTPDALAYMDSQGWRQRQAARP